VYKIATPGSPEKVVNGGCHATRDEALAQQRALYAKEPAAAAALREDQAMPEQFIVPIENKALTDAGDGGISGLASVYGNVDLQDDEMQRGAADRSIAHHKTARAKMPLLDWHGESLSRLIGSVKELKSVPEGVWFDAAFSGTPEAQRARQLAREGHLSGVSIGYLPVRSSYKTVGGRPIRMLHEVKLLEISLTPVPANPLAQVASVKAAAKPYGDVPYADPGYLDADGNQASKSGKPGVKRYPLDEKHVMAAWTYINHADNAAQYTAEQLSAIKSRIRSAMAKFGHQVSEAASLGLRESLAVIIEIPSLAARKAAAAVLLDEYLPPEDQPEDDDDAAPADEPEPAADGPAPDPPEGTLGTPDGPTPREYATMIANRGIADGSPASLDALEARIRQNLENLEKVHE